MFNYSCTNTQKYRLPASALSLSLGNCLLLNIFCIKWNWGREWEKRGSSPKWPTAFLCMCLFLFLKTREIWINAFVVIAKSRRSRKVNTQMIIRENRNYTMLNAIPTEDSMPNLLRSKRDQVALEDSFSTDFFNKEITNYTQFISKSLLTRKYIPKA